MQIHSTAVRTKKITDSISSRSISGSISGSAVYLSPFCKLWFGVKLILHHVNASVRQVTSAASGVGVSPLREHPTRGRRTACADTHTGPPAGRAGRTIPASLLAVGRTPTPCPGPNTQRRKGPDTECVSVCVCDYKRLRYTHYYNTGLELNDNLDVIQYIKTNRCLI